MGRWLNLLTRTDDVAVSEAASRARCPGDGADDAATSWSGWFESSFELQRGLAVVELQGTVRWRPAAAAAVQSAAVAAPAWSLT